MRLLAKDSVCDGPEGCGVSGALFPYANTDGKHDLPIPGNFWDQAVEDALAPLDEFLARTEAMLPE